MRRTASWVGLIALGAIVVCGCGPKQSYFGEPMKMSAAEAIPVSEVLDKPDAYNGKYISVSGQVSSVCANKGCWLRMTDGRGTDSVFVKFTCPVEGRLIPMEAVGHKVVVEGTLQVEEVPEADARHYAEEAGKSPDEIAMIVGVQKQLRMASPAARIEGLEQSALKE